MTCKTHERCTHVLRLSILDDEVVLVYLPRAKLTNGGRWIWIPGRKGYKTLEFLPLPLIVSPESAFPVGTRTRTAQQFLLPFRLPIKNAFQHHVAELDSSSPVSRPECRRNSFLFAHTLCVHASPLGGVSESSGGRRTTRPCRCIRRESTVTWREGGKILKQSTE